jgi:hypothetical protein
LTNTRQIQLIICHFCYVGLGITERTKEIEPKVPIPTKRPIESLAASQAPIYLKPELRLGGGNSASGGSGHLTCDVESRQRGWKFVWPGKLRPLSSVTCQNGIGKILVLFARVDRWLIDCDIKMLFKSGRNPFGRMEIQLCFAYIPTHQIRRQNKISLWVFSADGAQKYAEGR